IMKKFIVVMFVFASSVMNAAWEKTFGGEGNDYGNAIKQTLDGGLIIAGASASFGSVSAKITKGWLIKLDESGNMEWEYSFGSYDKKDGFNSVELTEDGGYIVGGYTQDLKMWLVKFDEEGTVQWDSVYNDNLASSINDVESVQDGGYIIVGSGKYNIIKCDKSGNWNLFAKHGWVIYDIQRMKDGGYVLVGEIIGIPQEFGYTPSPFIMKIGADGNTIWDNPYKKEDLGRFVSVTETTDGGLVVTGVKITKVDEHLFTNQLVVTRFDNIGRVEWEQLGVVHSGGFAVELDGEDYIVAGNTPGIDGCPDNYIARIGNDGIVKWDTAYGGDKYDYPSDMLIEKNGSIVIVGQTESSGEGFYDLQVVKIDPPVNPSPVENINYQSPNKSVLNSPNPFSISTTISANCDAVNPDNIRMDVYSQTGKLIASYKGFYGSEGNYTRTINSNGLLPGAYYYKVKVGNRELMGRMILQK
ncbi:T9SS type A sorting domain-containing protein, partial [Bacteroidota bacterium]